MNELEMISRSALLIIVDIILIVLLVFLVAGAVYLIMDKGRRAAREAKRMLGNDESRATKIDLTEKTMAFINNLVGRIAVIQFRDHTDKIPLDKTNISLIRDIVDRTAREAHDAVKRDEVFSNLAVSEEFLLQYIVDSSVMIVKEMVNTAADNYES